MPHTLRLHLTAALLMAALWLPAFAKAEPIYRSIEVSRADDSTVDVQLIDRGSGTPDRVLLVIAGSDCRTARAQSWIDQILMAASVRWVALVEKEGSTATGRCGADYERYSTEEARWYDHLQAMRRLKRDLGLRAQGAFQVIGISAGGLTACAVAGATEDVGDIALLGAGGGVTFAEELALLTQGEAAMAADIARVGRDPRLGRNWMGDENPEIWWWSVLDKRCRPLLNGYRGRALIVHGTKDESVPLHSARTLASALKASSVEVSYLELDTGHDLGQKDGPAASNGVAHAMNWLAKK